MGAWRNLRTIVLSDGETVVTETQWVFGSDGSCSRTVIQTFVIAGVEDRDVRGCRYVVGGSSVSITFDGSSAAATFSVTFSGGDLLLDGFRFTRFG